MPLDFHRRAAAETILFLDALGIERAVLWGHSDGAVISAMTGLAAPSDASF
jgi:pimeloyl-ACP methyl ester carboxylesterase